MFTDRQLDSRSATATAFAGTTATATIVAPSPVRRAEATAPALAAHAGELRHLAAAHLAAWALSDADHHAALLITGELLANAVQHGRSTMTLTITLHPQLLHISVADHGSGPGPRADAATGPTTGATTTDDAAHLEDRGDPDEHGRGLVIVTALAAWVEVVHDESGHQVWAALGLTPD